MKVGYEVFRRQDADGAAADLDHRPQPVLEGGSLTRPPLSGNRIRPAGNGRSERPLTPDAYARPVVDHAMAILDATGTDRVITVSLSQGAQEGLKLAADHADRVLGAGVRYRRQHHPRAWTSRAGTRSSSSTSRLRPNRARWEKLNAQYSGLNHYEDFVEFFFSASPNRIPPSNAKTAEDGQGRPPPKRSSPTWAPCGAGDRIGSLTQRADGAHAGHPRTRPH